MNEQANPPPVAVIGVGNVLMGDEGIGIHVIRALQRRRIPRRIEVIDGGTGGLALLTLVHGRERVIIVDAAMAGGPPGAVYLWRTDTGDTPNHVFRSAHTEGVEELIRAGRALGILPPVLCLGIVPAVIDTPGTRLSPALRKRLPAIARAVLREGIQRSALPERHT